MDEEALLAKIDELKEVRKNTTDNMRRGEINREMMYFAKKLTKLYE